MINLIKLLLILIIWCLIILYIKNPETFIDNVEFIPWGHSEKGCINRCIITNNTMNLNSGQTQNLTSEQIKTNCEKICSSKDRCSENNCLWLDTSKTINDNVGNVDNDDNVDIDDKLYNCQIIPFNDSVIVNWKYKGDNSDNINKFILQIIDRNNTSSGIRLYENTKNTENINTYTIDNLNENTEYNISIYPIFNNNNNNNNSIDESNESYMSEIYSFKTKNSYKNIINNVL